MRKEFRVSTKATIYSSDRSHVLVVHMDKDDNYGLPGGHIEENETPDEAMARELLEETGISSSDLRHVDFFVHSQGKLILAYIGTADSETLKSQQNGLDGEPLEGKPKWLTRDEFEAITIEPGYRDLVLNNW